MPLENSQTGTDPSVVPTRQLLYPLGVLPSFTVPILNDGDIHAEALYKLDDFAEPRYQRGLSRAHVPRPTMYRQRTDARPHNPLDELLGLLLRRQQTNLCRHGDLGG